MVLITGSKGQLARTFIEKFDKNNLSYLALTREELDIRDYKVIEKLLSENSFDVIINCAAYNNVEKAEEENKVCYETNVIGNVNLAKLAKEFKCKYITYSSDYVFDGLKKEAYIETDNKNPLSYYGKTKSEMEDKVLNIDNSALVIRTSWLFGNGENNFIKNIIKLIESNSEIKMTNDQLSSLSYTYDIIDYTLMLLDLNKKGIYHITNSGESTKYEQALYLLKNLNLKNKLRKDITEKIEKVRSSYFNPKAKRPAYSKLSTKKIEQDLNIKIPSWQNAIDRYLSK